MRNTAFPVFAAVVSAAVGALASPHLANASIGTTANPYVSYAYASDAGNAGPAFGDRLIQGSGTSSIGRFNNFGGFDAATVAWFPDHFGLFARGALDIQDASNYANSGARGDAYGSLQDPILIPAQGGAKAGDHGTFILHYQLKGNVSLSIPAFPNDTGYVDLKWISGSVDITSNTALPTHQDLVTHWTANATVDQPVDIVADFYYDQPFALQMNVWLAASIFMSNVPMTHAFVGFAEGDFSHTGTILGATILDGNGLPIANPQLFDDSGFNYFSPTPVPEPASLCILVPATLLLLKRRRV
jgi:hypothetical protein